MTLAWIPNALTLLRCGLAFVVGWMILKIGGSGEGALLAFCLFSGVAATDFLDGYAARKLNAVSAFGAFLDPVADKLLVAIALLALCHLQAWGWLLLVPSLVIIARDTFVTLIRLKPGISLPVSRLAKWKTAGEMLGIGLYLLALLPQLAVLFWPAVGLIYLAALLSAITGAQYLRAAAGSGAS